MQVNQQRGQNIIKPTQCLYFITVKYCRVRHSHSALIRYYAGSPRTMSGIVPSPGPGMLLDDTSASTRLLELAGVLMPGSV